VRKGKIKMQGNKRKNKRKKTRKTEWK